MSGGLGHVSAISIEFRHQAAHEKSEISVL